MCGRYAMGMAIDYMPQVLNDSMFDRGGDGPVSSQGSSTNCSSYETTTNTGGHKSTVHVDVVSDKYSPSYNIPPTGKGIIIYMDGEDSDRHYKVEPSSFGLLPEWAKKTDSSPVKRGANVGPEYSREIQRHQAKYFNCRRETVMQDKSIWDSPVKHRRCVVPVQGYFEWSAHDKTPYFVYSESKPVLYLAGLFSHNTNYNDTEMVDGLGYFSSFAIVTGPASGKGSNDLSWLHPRKPLFIQPNSKAWFEWLGKNDLDKKILAEDCLKATDNPVYNEIVWHRVATSVGNPSNNGPEVMKEEKVKQSSITSFFAKTGKEKRSLETKDKSPKKAKFEVVGSESTYKEESSQDENSNQEDDSD